MLNKNMIELLRENKDFYPLEFTTAWQGSPHDGFEVHCLNCIKNVYIGEMCYVKYLKYISIVICYDCSVEYADELTEWLI